MLNTDQIKDNQYKELSQSIEMTSFTGQTGLNKACELSDKIYNLQFTIFCDQGHTEYQIEETEFYSGERFIQALDYHACQSGFLSPQLESLHDELIKKVVIAQKGSLIFPYSLHQTNQKEHNELTNNYIKICEELKGIKNKKLLVSIESFNNSHDIFNPQRNKISFADQDKFQENRLIDEKKIKVEQLIKGLVKVKKCKRFLEPVLHGLCAKVETEQESKGFFFRVTNKKGVHSYLAGTIHTATNHMAQMPALNNVIDHSDRLILEVSSSILNAGYRLRRLNLTNPYRNCIDLTLYDAAWYRNIPIESLETVKDQINAFYGDAVANASYSEIGYAMISSATAKIMPYVDDYVKGYMKSMTTGTTQDKMKDCIGYIAAPSIWLIKKEIQLGHKLAQKFWEWYGLIEPAKQPIEERAQIAILNDMWQAGDASLFPTLCQQLPEAVTSVRNFNWLKNTEKQQGMVERLETTEESLCYAFGAGHLVAGNPNILGVLGVREDLTLEQGEYNYKTSEMEWKKSY